MKIIEFDLNNVPTEYPDTALCLGFFDDLEEAVAVRHAAEDKYFGEFGYRRSRGLSNNKGDVNGIF